jgi:hypothetical protein
MDHVRDRGHERMSEIMKKVEKKINSLAKTVTWETETCL